MSGSPAVFDRHVVILNVARFAKALSKREQKAFISLRRCAIEEPDHRHRWLLRKCGEWPCQRNAAKTGYGLSSADIDCHPIRPDGIMTSAMLARISRQYMKVCDGLHSPRGRRRDVCLGPAAGLSRPRFGVRFSRSALALLCHARVGGTISACRDSERSSAPTNRCGPRRELPH